MYDPTLPWIGPYKDLSPLEAFGKHLARPFAAKRETLAAMAVIGLIEGDPKLDAAISDFWRWKTRHHEEDFPKSKIAEYRINMRRAKAEWRKPEGDPMPHLIAATDAKIAEGAMRGKARYDIAKAILNRRILANLPKDQLTQYTRKAPEWALQKLRLHDDALETWAKAYIKKTQ